MDTVDIPDLSPGIDHSIETAQRVYMNNGNSLTSINTFSSDEIDLVNDSHNVTNDNNDNELFEHYNGSIKDLADKVVVDSSPIPIIEEKPIPIKPTPLKYDKPYKNYRKPSTIINDEMKRIENKIIQLELQFNELNTKYYKLEKEINYVDEILSSENSSKSIQYQKLLFARGKLMDKLQTVKKERYDIGVVISKLRRKVNGDDSGDMTQYFARNVSS